MKRKIKIGTRGSQLALWQANHIKSILEKSYPDYTFELVKIKTQGDKILDVALSKVGGKGLFVKELEDALLEKKVDFAVHSMKDVPVILPEGLHLTAITKREDPRDCFLSKNYNSLSDLPESAKVGTSSLRRQCQILSLRKDLQVEVLRGNVETRIRKMTEGVYDAVILAYAGVKRLNLMDYVKEVISEDLSLPAIGQGALGIECRVDDDEVNNLLSILNDDDSAVCVKAERAFLRVLEGGCQVPIGSYGRIIDNKLVLKGLVGTLDGKTIIKETVSGEKTDAEALGESLAEVILSKGGKKILEEVYGREMGS
ncbi:MAG: hydroxymethylbilane synthase [Proteobacteria bacterium]|nr:hydroxymethylbilane synthase [Pseudomonadota bacterium]